MDPAIDIDRENVIKEHSSVAFAYKWWWHAQNSKIETFKINIETV